MNEIYFKKIAVLVLMMGVSLVSCTTAPPEVPEAGYYKEYDQKVNELRDAVERGELTITEAEKMRQVAFREYFSQMEEKKINMEYRNY